MDLEIRPIAGGSFYVPGRVNVGVWVDGDSAILIDSGGDENAGRQLNRAIAGMGWKLEGIVNTHSNADHIGGNAYLQKKTGCWIAATSVESVLIERPRLEPTFLWGANPFAELKNKFLEAQPSKVERTIGGDGSIPGTPLRAVPLPGHFLDMVGVKSPDGVFYVADSVFSAEIVEKYRFIVTLDVGAALATLDLLEGDDAAFFVPCHADAGKSIRPASEATRKGILLLSERVYETLAAARSEEDVLAAVFESWGLEMTPQQFVLSRATLAAHLTHLASKGRIAPRVDGGRLLWERTQ